MKSSFYLLFFTLAGMAIAPVAAAQLHTTSGSPDTPDATAAAAPETRFDPVIDDLPLMDGLTPVPDQATLFTAPHGRIAESVVKGAVDPEDVYRFYRRALPQLGWKILGPDSYHRNGEKLSIEARADHGTTVVHFSIKPE